MDCSLVNWKDLYFTKSHDRYYRSDSSNARCSLGYYVIVEPRATHQAEQIELESKKVAFISYLSPDLSDSTYQRSVCHLKAPGAQTGWPR